METIKNKIKRMRKLLERDVLVRRGCLSKVMDKARDTAQNKTEYNRVAEEYFSYLQHDSRYAIWRNYLTSVDGSELKNRIRILKENLGADPVYACFNLPILEQTCFNSRGEERTHGMIEMEERTMTKKTYEKYLSEVIGRPFTTEEYEREYGFLSDENETK